METIIELVDYTPQENRSKLDITRELRNISKRFSQFRKRVALPKAPNVNTLGEYMFGKKEGWKPVIKAISKKDGIVRVYLTKEHGKHKDIIHDHMLKDILLPAILVIKKHGRLGDFEFKI